MAQGVDKIPIRWPREYDAAFMERIFRDVLAKADIRNSVEGPGITIEGQSDEPATISSSEDLMQLTEQTFVLALPSGFLENERILQGEPSVISITDEGPGGNIIVDVENNGIGPVQFRQSVGGSVVGRRAATTGNVSDIIASSDNDVLRKNGGILEFGSILSLSISDFDEAAQDAVGGILVNSPSIAFNYDDATPEITAQIDESFEPTWTGEHLFTTTTTFAPATVAPVLALSPSIFMAKASAVGTGVGPVLQMDGFSGVAASSSPTIAAHRARGNTLGSPTVVQDGDRILRILARGYDGTNWVESASFNFRVEGTPAAGSVPGAVVFSTTPPAATVVVERFRMGPLGQFGIAGTNYGTAGQAFLSGGSSAIPAWTTLGANPSASIGLSAVNGSATTYLRSDAAPALAQNIAPTWTGQHTFNVQIIETTNILAKTTTTYADGAAAAAGTLLNAPSAGNPTKWIPVDDNGTTRYIPAW